MTGKKDTPAVKPGIFVAYSLFLLSLDTVWFEKRGQISGARQSPFSPQVQCCAVIS